MYDERSLLNAFDDALVCLVREIAKGQHSCIEASLTFVLREALLAPLTLVLAVDRTSRGFRCPQMVGPPEPLDAGVLDRLDEEFAELGVRIEPDHATVAMCGYAASGPETIKDGRRVWYLADIPFGEGSFFELWIVLDDDEVLAALKEEIDDRLEFVLRNTTWRRKLFEMLVALREARGLRDPAQVITRLSLERTTRFEERLRDALRLLDTIRAHPFAMREQVLLSLAAWVLQEVFGTGWRVCIPASDDNIRELSRFCARIRELCEELHRRNAHDVEKLAEAVVIQHCIAATIPDDLRREQPALPPWAERAPLLPRVMAIWSRAQKLLRNHSQNAAALEPSAEQAGEALWRGAIRSTRALLHRVSNTCDVLDPKQHREHFRHWLHLWFCLEMLSAAEEIEDGLDDFTLWQFRADVAYVLREALRALHYGDNPAYRFQPSIYTAALRTIVIAHASQRMGLDRYPLALHLEHIGRASIADDYYFSAAHLQHVLECYILGHFLLSCRTDAVVKSGASTPVAKLDQLEAEAVEELPKVFHRRDRAVRLVDKVGFAPQMRPVFTTPDVFWSRIVSHIRFGANPGHVRLVIAEAAKQYPNNPVFGRYLQAGRQSPASPPTAVLGERTVADVLVDYRKGLCGDEFDQSTLRRAWSLTALFHDMGMILFPRIRTVEDELCDGESKFHKKMKEVLEEFDNVRLNLFDACEQDIRDVLTAVHIDQEIGDWLEEQKGERLLDHALLSAWFLNRLAFRRRAQGKPELVDALRAILLHGARMARIEVGRDPVAALLVLCDEIFEWKPLFRKGPSLEAVGNSLHTMAANVGPYRSRTRGVVLEGVELGLSGDASDLEDCRLVVRLAAPHSSVWPRVELLLQRPEFLDVWGPLVWLSTSQNLERVDSEQCDALVPRVRMRSYTAPEVERVGCTMKKLLSITAGTKKPRVGIEEELRTWIRLRKQPKVRDGVEVIDLNTDEKTDWTLDVRTVFKELEAKMRGALDTMKRDALDKVNRPSR